jgi:hypothetical protein
MKKRKVIFFLLPGFFIAFALVFPSSARGYSLSFKFELGTSAGLTFPSMDTSYHNRFAPTFQPGNYESYADQTLSLRGKKAAGLNAVFCFYPLENFGFQVLADYSRCSITGKSTNYDVSLTHEGYNWQKTLGMPDTKGRLKQFTYSFNAATRIGITNLAVLGFSGGVSLFDISGRFTSLGYTRFWEEQVSGQTKLVIKDYKLGAEFGTTKLGFNAGGEFDIDLILNTTLYLDVRYFYCSKLHAKLNLISDPIITEPLNQLEKEMNLESLAFNPSFFRINLGLKIVF